MLPLIRLSGSDSGILRERLEERRQMSAIASSFLLGEPYSSERMLALRSQTPEHHHQ